MPVPVLLFNAPRSCYRPILVGDGEHYNTRSPAPSDVPTRDNISYRPRGRYDASALVASMTGNFHDPSIVVCQWDCEEQSIPYNLAGIKCPKVLIIGDTHHTPSPLTRSVRLALAEPWDLVVLEFNERHLHWFHEAGVKQAVYIPCWSISPIDIKPPVKRTRGVTLCGSMGPDHVYRKRVFDALWEKGIKVEHFSGSREFCAKIYNESLVSLNISLNGDFNLRNYEIAAAGGCMVGEKDNNGDAWSSIDEMVGVIRKFSDPIWSLNRGRCSYDDFWWYKSPQQKIDALWKEATREVPTFKSPRIDTNDFWYQLSIYERVQEFVMRGQVRASDFDDLARWAI